MKRILVTSLVISLPVFLWLRGEAPQPQQPVLSAQTHDGWMKDIQHQLKQDPNQAELWFQLGHGYLNEQDFSSALTCFDYAIRLSPEASANQFAAKATALYFERSQRMTEEVNHLLAQALELDASNVTALTLIANDHFISFRYQEAIETWTQLLDSQRQDIDRVAVIHSLNQAKAMLGRE
ncbi:nitrite reductase [Vibrio coralliilyticus]|uniref:TPR domain-containing protein n=1 Tax=Vibrio coralliilyticus TaxID=190893 RepID=UPI0008106EF1|nr:tetratricopeptide repeat protein [Vibrio coralliilyticus]ANW23625.1 nitrite reductase [Vibrio coralliilyticus]